ncbi:MAG: hypothetical protein J6R77_08420 [Clostridia bacterium]|nr:hypothetical protein [Clostridia bacterium]
MVNYTELYALLGDLTPLPADCGEVCAAACCGGGDGDGMLLFPGEESLLGGDGCILRENGREVFVCHGTCDRDHRPLACRLFPLFPYLTEEGRIRVVYDPAAFRLCPLVQLKERVRLQREFVRAVAAVGYRLRRDPVGRAFLEERSREIDEINRFLRLDEGRAPICRR